MAAEPPQRPLRVVFFPWLAFGHLLPHLELTERLASRGHRATLVSTPGNVARLPPAPRVDLVALPLPRVDGLPDGAESTNSIPQEKHSLLFQAFDGLAAPFAEFLAAACADERRRPDWIVVDIFHHWAAAAALEHKVPLAVYLPAAAALVRNPAAVVPRYELERTNVQTKSDHGGMSMSQRFFFTLERCTLLAMRSCVEWEPEFFPQVAQRLRKPVVPLGLLPPSLPPRANGAEDEDATVRWLDAQPPGSVVYVALGSEAPLPVEQVHELGLGLEHAGTRFLWALRKPASGVPDDDDGGDLLPPGFLERTQGRQGLVTTGWVPQVSILAHAAVGAFLTHCGQSSFVEGLLFGRPLILLPIFGDQGPNARLLEGKKVGLQVARDEGDGSFDRHAVASAVRAVMVEEETRGAYVANALKAQEIVANRELHERYIDEFVRQLRSHTCETVRTRQPPNSTSKRNIPALSSKISSPVSVSPHPSTSISQTPYQLLAAAPRVIHPFLPPLSPLSPSPISFTYPPRPPPRPLRRAPRAVDVSRTRGSSLPGAGQQLRRPAGLLQAAGPSSSDGDSAVDVCRRGGTAAADEASASRPAALLPPQLHLPRARRQRRADPGEFPAGRPSSVPSSARCCRRPRVLAEEVVVRRRHRDGEELGGEVQVELGGAFLRLLSAAAAASTSGSPPVQGRLRVWRPDSTAAPLHHQSSADLRLQPPAALSLSLRWSSPSLPPRLRQARAPDAGGRPVVVGTVRIRRVAPRHEAAVAFTGWTPGMAAAGGNWNVQSPFQSPAAGFLTLKANCRPATVPVASPSADSLSFAFSSGWVSLNGQRGRVSVVSIPDSTRSASWQSQTPR